MKITTYIAYALTIIGALVWLIVGLFAFNPVGWLFGEMAVIPRIIYSLVGISGLWLIFYFVFLKPAGSVR